jgi:hypothetical protein
MMFSTNGQVITLNIRIPRDSSLHSMQVDVQMSVADISHSIQQYLSATTDHDRKSEDREARISDCAALIDFSLGVWHLRQ